MAVQRSDDAAVSTTGPGYTARMRPFGITALDDIAIAIGKTVNADKAIRETETGRRIIDL